MTHLLLTLSPSLLLHAKLDTHSQCPHKLKVSDFFNITGLLQKKELLLEKGLSCPKCPWISNQDRVFLWLQNMNLFLKVSKQEALCI